MVNGRGLGAGDGEGFADGEAIATGDGGRLDDEGWAGPTLGSGVVEPGPLPATRPSSATPVMNRLAAARATTSEAARIGPIRRAMRAGVERR